MNQANPTLAQVVRSYVAAGAAELRVCTIGRIERFDPAKQVADVKPLLKDSVEGEDGSELVESLAVIPNVPVHFPGGGGFAETWPVAAGDLCTLVFTDRSIDRWFSNGGEIDPVDLGRHLLTSATAHMGVRDLKSALAEFDSARAVWGNKGPRIAADGSAIHLGVAHNESGTQDAVRGPTFMNALDQLLTVIDTNTTTAGSSVSTAGASITAAAPLNAVPMYGGALAATPLIAAGASLSAAGVALTAIKAGITAFKALRSTLTTSKVKTP